MKFQSLSVVILKLHIFQESEFWCDINFLNEVWPKFEEWGFEFKFITHISDKSKISIINTPTITEPSEKILLKIFKDFNQVILDFNEENKTIDIKIPFHQ